MRFVIIGSPRTGSSHLVNMLGAHPEIWCHGNVFKSQARGLPMFLPKGKLDQAEENRLLDLRSSNEAAFLEEVYRLDHGRAHIGFKIFEGQSDAMLEQLLNDTLIKKVVLYRDNVLANYSSMRAAQESGHWGAKENTIAEPSPVSFKKTDFIKFHNSYIAFYKRVIDVLVRTRQSFYWMDYSAINDISSLAALVTFIGADGSVPISETDQRKQQIKQNSSDILSRFKNARRVKKFLEDNGLFHWMHEGSRSIETMARD